MMDRLRARLFDYSDPESFVNRVRRKRSAFFMELVSRLPVGGPVRVLDIGGTCRFWETSVGRVDPERMRITLLNLAPIPVPDGAVAFTAVAGNALHLPFGDGEFDVVFSNSVIEHVGSREGQRRMADEVRRAGTRFFIQTPSLWFPLEAHSHIPGFQFWPRSVRAMAIRTGKIHYFPAKATFRECLEVSDSTILVTRKAFKGLFPGARIHTERLFGIPKSYTATHGWPGEQE